MTEIYSVGTIAVTEGSVDFVGTGTGWLPPNVKAGDQLNVAGMMMGIAEITDATHGKFAVPYPGADGAGLPYAIFKTSSEWGTNRSLSMSTAEMIQLLSTLEVPNTGLRFDALGNFAGRSNYDDRPTAFGYLSLNGDGAGGTDPVVFAKLSGTDADWSAPISFRGGVGATGPSGVLVNWRGAWVTATAYALKDGVQFGGSSYICTIAHVAGDFATDLAAGRWELTSAQGAPGNDGVLSANEEIVTAASRTITAADNGKIFIANRAAGVTFNFDPVASLGTKWLGMFKNIGAGPLTIDPDAVETIDGVASLMLSTSESAMISGNGALLRSHFRGSAGGKRELLTAARTYYVRTDGNDANDGLANTVGGAFLTIQKAIDVAATLDTSIYDVTIQLGAGTYNIVAPGLVAKQVAGAGKIIIVGDEVTPGNVVIAISGVVTGLDSIFKSAGVKTIYSLRGFRVSATATGTLFGIVASSGSLVEIQNLDFGSMLTGTNSQQLRVEDNGIILATGNYSISGGAAWHWVSNGGGILRIQSRTITITGTPAFTTAFMEVSRGGIAFVNVNTFVGGATGIRYIVQEGGIAVAGPETYLPGNAAGTRASGGVYNSVIGGVREVLTANRTYYVRADGSDSNDGLTNTAGGAFLTIQKAITVTQALDRSVFNVLISVGAGTFASAQNAISGMGPGANPVSITGAGATTIISTTGNCFYVTNAVVSLVNMKLTSSGASGIRAEAGAFVTHSGLDFGACTSGNHIWLEQWARAACTGNYAISGSANSHVFVRYSGGSYECFAKTLTLTGTPAFAGAFVTATSLGIIVHGACTFVGGATGKRFSADTGGIIDSGGGGANYFPGSVAGTGTTLAAAPYGAYV